jgi:hypothetical protein
MAAIAIASIIVRAPSSGAAQIFRKATDQNFWNHHKATLVREIASWQRARNESRARVRWMFTVEKARAKMGRAYPPVPAPAANAAA